METYFCHSLFNPFYVSILDVTALLGGLGFSDPSFQTSLSDVNLFRTLTIFGTSGSALSSSLIFDLALLSLDFFWSSKHWYSYWFVFCSSLDISSESRTIYFDSLGVMVASYGSLHSPKLSMQFNKSSFRYFVWNIQAVVLFASLKACFLICVLITLLFYFCLIVD